MFSPTTLALFKQLLDQTSLSAAAPDFDALASAISIARRELSQVLEAPETTSNGSGPHSVKSAP